MRRNALTAVLVACAVASSTAPLFGSAPAASLERPDARAPSLSWDAMRGPMTMPLPAGWLSPHIVAGREGRS